MQQHIAIVEPYFSGALLAERFRARGFDCIAIHLRPLEGKAAASFRNEDFVASLMHDGDLTTLVATLGHYSLAAVLPGIEGGVLLADQLATHFNLPGNDPARSLARRDKYLMHQQIADCGLRAIEQIRVSDLADLTAWLESYGRWPVVVKPALSGATDSVRICENAAEAHAAFSNAIDQVNALGVRNDTMIAQEYIQGTEFVIDAVTCNGRHQVVSVAYYRKERGAEGAPIYREMYFVRPEEWGAHEALLTYALAVLDALGVTCGPSHTEIFVDAAGPVLVESGARLCGGMVPLYLEAVAETSPLELAVSSFVDTDAFESAAAEPQRHNASLRAYFVRNSQRGRVAARPGDRLLRSLRTFKDVIWYASEGSEIIPTRDLWSGLGLVFLLSPDEAAINDDVALVEQWERDNMLVSVE
ncbi:ATP-grasp domain-containing protein [Rhizorhapis suberifaciens]|uniref:Biotin carboxylase n=1 Tax=Rhizorhapis suberifaciens TaxID=13656 RepID=A0A840HZ16_9SPHN|nr:ATP-grasp domain-containing protein [Rhizorhapis suberifaciens]MBB4642656.1 biotin carboxylase [Rhizorhapis suberifaciens]